MSNKRFYWYRVWMTFNGWGFAVPAQVKLHMDELHREDIVRPALEEWVKDAYGDKAQCVRWNFMGRVDAGI